ncbi:MAG TPA: tRNA (adenosine(37)-N6)-threonylcarbamoyltransferase complex ATPase subunit type 1 TsaE, partial [Arenibacter sp.]|nr:tRNA (adenosine(37)-N6)-threonylcarbamoyltransferase complex ATPase subunit type 1 TsaE [Arenibacter sp.]
MTISYNISQISDVAQQLIAKFPSKTLCFYGEMGAGKTTLIKA